MKLALFDLDNTLLAGDSDFEWAQFLIAQGVLDREAYEARNLEFYEQYKAGTLDIHVFLDFQLKPLSRHPRSQLDAWHALFMQTRILPMIGRQARDLVNQHRAEGHVLAIITATNSFVTAPIAREFGVPVLIATEPEQRAGEFTGLAAGIPCFREGKVKRLEAWLAGQGADWPAVERSWFYSDSHNDLFLMERVTDPIAVDPDPQLTEAARVRGWPVISLR
ncbi:MAG: phosphoserine phosphatase [Betaproteobacteria bacterium RBG_16_58_11]|nr:MAG: phosphoserine phosphatase [Betaproteobacteria bacterium RBG_16_58_11]OFZ96981.1 MAG: phosphoserine phosphatase [Betaproteobacteria bacterium RBG_19FT_COMBO_58_11]